MKTISKFFLVFLLVILNTATFSQYNVGSGGGFAYANLGTSDNGSLLPMTLVSFSAECFNHSILLKWVTASEVNNDFFTIERSFDAIRFETVGTISGAGNSNNLMDYSLIDNKFIDDNYSFSTIYYRLIQTDFDGKFSYSQIISSDCVQKERGYADVKIFPNPNNGLFELTGLQSQTHFSILSLDGQVVFKGNLNEKSSKMDISFLQAGIYFIRLETGVEWIIKKLVIQ
ncbi:MAG: T9SS type A sorting domain-containing protein [Bacteroidales bacterium]|nr:T9SS type A sorting domain-containing protein [Bacteroidales bacterium]